MAGLTPAHLLIILFIALIVIGPGKLPEVGAAIGKSVREFKRATGDLQETLTGPLNAQPPTPAQAQAPLPAAYPPQAPYQRPPIRHKPRISRCLRRPMPATYPPSPVSSRLLSATSAVSARYRRRSAPPAPLGYPAPAIAEYRPATGTIVEPPPTPRVG